MNVFDRIKKNSGIFLDEGKLSPDYVPDDILYRENEIRELAFCLQGIVNGKRGENAIVTGPPGTGKTTCAKHVISQLKEHSKKAIPIYVNCWEFSSKFSVLGEIANKMGEILPRRGIALDEIMDRVIQTARLEKAGIVAVLDEADRLILEGEEGIFYDFARFPEMHGVNFSVIAIANRKELFSEMDARIRSSLSAKSIEFLQYTPEQLRGILKGRARVSFVPGALDEEVIPMCAGIGAKRSGDARIAISVLRAAGKEAEKEGAKKVTTSHVQKAKERILEEVEKRKIPQLEPSLQEIFGIVEKAGGELDSGELYEKLGTTGENEERVARKHVAKLEELGFLESEIVKKGAGKSRMIRVKKN